MEEDKLIESKKILTDYMLELNNDIQRAEDWVNTGADEEMYFAIKTVIDELERLQKENNDLRTIKETIRYLEEDGEKDDLYYVVGRGSYLAKVLENAQDFQKTVHTCLHCGKDTPLYCENCYQELISKNAELQLENNQLKRKIFDLYNSSGEYEKAKSIMTKELRDYIPKQVLRNRIADLEEVKSKYNFLIGTSYRADGAINTLKELLGE